jgi:hypothetical protein
MTANEAKHHKKRTKNPEKQNNTAFLNSEKTVPQVVKEQCKVRSTGIKKMPIGCQPRPIFAKKFDSEGLENARKEWFVAGLRQTYPNTAITRPPQRCSVPSL